MGELEDDVYVYYHVTDSESQGSGKVVICCDNEIRSFSGKVSIVYVDGRASAEISYYPRKDSDIKLLVPKGTVKFLGGGD